MKQLTPADTFPVQLEMASLIGYITGIASGMHPSIRDGLLQRANALANVLEIAPIHVDANGDPR